MIEWDGHAGGAPYFWTLASACELIERSNVVDKLEAICKKWHLLKADLMRVEMAHIAALLTDSEPVAFSQDVLTVRVPYKTMADVFNKRAHAFEPPLVAAIERVTGITCCIQVSFA